MGYSNCPVSIPLVGVIFLERCVIHIFNYSDFKIAYQTLVGVANLYSFRNWKLEISYLQLVICLTYCQRDVKSRLKPNSK